MHTSKLQIWYSLPPVVNIQNMASDRDIVGWPWVFTHSSPLISHSPPSLPLSVLSHLAFIDLHVLLLDSVLALALVERTTGLSLALTTPESRARCTSTRACCGCVEGVALSTGATSSAATSEEEDHCQENSKPSCPSPTETITSEASGDASILESITSLHKFGAEEC